MIDSSFPQLRNPPIVEAVLDFDCDPPSGFDLAAREEAARMRFADRYPKSRKQFLQGFRIEARQNEMPSTSTHHGLQALQFLQEDEKQLVQVRAQGFSFNRLAPYSHLENYLPEIERSWRAYVDLASPVQLRMMRLRYINRILLPFSQGINLGEYLNEYLNVSPRMIDQERLRLTGFLTQQLFFEVDTSHEGSLVLTGQAPENDRLPIILDITVAAPVDADPSDWAKMRQTIDSLRALKNWVFFTSLAPKCIELFR
jgi:uncharacterized protein (TIGR04255 family)